MGNYFTIERVNHKVCTHLMFGVVIEEIECPKNNYCFTLFYFRLILAMDPNNGEISRAMRNRGVEIFMLHDVCTIILCDLIFLKYLGG